MITDPGVRDYLDSLDPGNGALLEEIRGEAAAQEVPVIRRDTEALLKTVIALKQPEEILEVGTAVAYSALVMAESTEAAHITTIENWPPRIEGAKRNLGRAGMEERITLLEGDAGQILPGLPPERFDLIFMDAAKGQYLNWLPHLLKCLKTGGVLITDNVLQDGTVAASRFAIDRRERTIHARMRSYLRALTRTEGLVTSVTPCGDGTAVTVRTAGYRGLPEEYRAEKEEHAAEQEKEAGAPASGRKS